jgi:hypothetical protein
LSGSGGRYEMSRLKKCGCKMDNRFANQLLRSSFRKARDTNAKPSFFFSTKLRHGIYVRCGIREPRYEITRSDARISIPNHVSRISYRASRISHPKSRISRIYSPAPNTSQLAARMKARRILRSLGARPSQPKRLLRRSRQGGWKGFGEFRKDTSELCSEELHSGNPFRRYIA